VFGLCGSLGIVCLTFAGGLVFDQFGRSAPFAMMGIVNFAVLAAALWVRGRSPGGPALATASAGTPREGASRPSAGTGDLPGA
jgi:hypothetical protein